VPRLLWMPLHSTLASNLTMFFHVPVQVARGSRRPCGNGSACQNRLTSDTRLSEFGAAKI
jgi:hypothetical protein